MVDAPAKRICEFCEHEWFPRQAEPPARCPRCQRPYSEDNEGMTMTRNTDEYQRPISNYPLLLRLSIDNEIGNLAKVTSAISEGGGDLGDIEIQQAGPDAIVRNFRIFCRDGDHARAIVETIADIPGIDIQLASDRTFQLHRRGKIEVTNKVNIRTMQELSHVYTPGVARVSMQVHDNPDSVWALTTKVNTVAVVTDGTAVLGLGDIGPQGALPVMEGKSMLFKSFGDIDAWPICLDTKDPEEIISVVKAIAPGFGGILLEDISAPRCFEIEDRLRDELDIPVMHDDQHGTAVVVLAALINALKIVKKRPEDVKMVLIGAGASGIACTKILMNFGVKNVTAFDTRGAVYAGREGLNPAKEWLADNTNQEGFDGSLREAMAGADLFLGLSGPRMLEPEDVDAMADDAIVFAMANPEPEIMPHLIEGRARVIATGRSDFPNQVNNVLCFPGVFRGALDSRATTITEEMKIVAARAIASVIPDDQLNDEYILPSVFNEEVGPAVAAAVGAEAIRSGHVRDRGSRIFV
ncbi:MAG: NAD-dependent malic enzyme [Dehalococcoidia bacterium]|nr:NAD-dependent malic enzyme [Dehalococcoidia bacterium]